MKSSNIYNGVDNLEVMECASNYNQFLVKQILKHIRANSEIMDFGAGNGAFASKIRNHAKSITCVEQDPVLIKVLERKGLQVQPEIAKFEDQSLDGIYSLNVLEHIEDDVEILRLLRQKLKPGAAFYLYVPAFELLYGAMDKKVGHVRRYSKKELSAKLTLAGFVIEDIRFTDSLGFFASIYLKFFGSSDGVISRKMVRFYDQTLFPVSLLIDKVLSRFLGKNLSVRARAP